MKWRFWEFPEPDNSEAIELKRKLAASENELRMYKTRVDILELRSATLLNQLEALEDKSDASV